MSEESTAADNRACLRDRLREASDICVIDRSVKGAIAYPVLMAIVVFSTEWRTSHQALGFSLLTLTLVTSTIRFWYLRRLIKHPELVAKQTPLGLPFAILTPTILYGLFVAASYLTFGVTSITAMVATLVALAFAAGGTSSLGMNRGLHLRFLLVLLLPLSTAGVATLTNAGIVIAGMNLLNVLFLLREGIAANDSFVEIFEKRFALEEVVQSLEESQSELLEVNQSMELVLDNIEQGLCVVDTAGVIQSHCSKVFDTWFGATQPGTRLVDSLGDKNFGEWFEVSMEMLVDDILPAELVLDQLPSLLIHNDRHMSFTYKLIEHEGATKGVLVVVSDITERITTQEAEREQRELVRLFQLLARDPDGFQEFRTSASLLVKNITKTNQSRNEQIRALHTLKGNAAVMGIDSLASLCHDLEDVLTEIDFALEIEQSQRLVSAWQETDDRMSTMLGERVNVLELTDAEHHSFIDMLNNHRSYEELLEVSHSWRLESVPRRLERMASQAQRAARTLDKDIEVQLEVSPLRLDADQWRDFWNACVHLIRNSVDHGIEDRETRIKHKKPPKGLLTLSAKRVEDEVVVKVRDDGNGIDWKRVAAKAETLGLQFDSEEALRNALFVEGMSTRDKVTAVSGRGVGLGALADATKRMGGVIEVDSRSGLGTVFTIRLPYYTRNTTVMASAPALA